MVVNLHQHVYRIRWFLTVQLIALIGWILVQSFFSLSPLGRALPFEVTIVSEAIWWILTLVIMFWLFRQVHKRFEEAVLQLEDANSRLRGSTNALFSRLKNQGGQEEDIAKPE
jgi:hypothetical protein